MKHELLRIEPRSAIRIGFFLGLLGGFILGVFEMLFFRAVSDAGGGAMLPAEAKALIGTGAGSYLMIGLVTGLVFSLIMALAGGLTAVFYNLAARMFGGVEMTLDDPPPPARDADETDGDDSEHA